MSHYEIILRMRWRKHLSISFDNLCTCALNIWNLNKPQYKHSLLCYRQTGPPAFSECPIYDALLWMLFTLLRKEICAQETHLSVEMNALPAA